MSRKVLLVALVPLASGCGLLFVEGPPTGHESMANIPCTESKALHTLDFVWAGLNALGTLLIAARYE